MEADQAPPMDPQQLAALHQAFVTAQQQIQQLQQALAAAQQQQQPPHHPALKPPKLTTFTGSAKDRRNLEDWLFSVDTHLAALPAPPAEVQRINYVAAYFTATALKWWRLHAPTLTGPNATYATFVTALRAAFGAHNTQLKAREQIDSLKHTTTVAAYNVKFRDLLLEVPDMQPPEQLYRYVAGLKPSTKQHVLITNPQTLDEAMALADRVDQTVYDARAGNPAGPRRRPWSTGHPGGAGPVPMEIGAMAGPPQGRAKTKLTPQDRQYLLDNNGCFYCRKLGHTIQQCRLRPRLQQPTARTPLVQGNVRRRSS